MHATRLHRAFWLRGDSLTVNDRRPLFTSIVNCSRWIAPAPNYTSVIVGTFRSATEIMAATTNDKFTGSATQAENTSAATRSVGVIGTRRLQPRAAFDRARNHHPPRRRELPPAADVAKQ